MTRGSALCGLALCALAAVSSPRAGARPLARNGAPWLGRVGIARVLVEVRRDRVRTTTVLTLPAAPGAARRLVLFASYGAPGPPLALDAELVATPRGYLAAPDSARGDKLPIRFEPTAPAGATVIVGRRHMAGGVIEIPRAEIARALRASGTATLRIRSVRAMPPPGAGGARELLVRLGTERGRAMLLGSVEVRGAHVTRRSACLCDRRGRDIPLAVLPVVDHDASRVPPPFAPRTPRDALCVSLWLD